MKQESQPRFSGRRIAIKLIHIYRYLLSPWIGNQCRFYPTCSHYTEEAIETHGFLKGCYLGLRRLLKCHPWHSGGVDLVPEKLGSKNRAKENINPENRAPQNSTTISKEHSEKECSEKATHNSQSQHGSNY